MLHFTQDQLLICSYTHSMTMVVKCTHSTVKLLNVLIQWLLAIECVDSMANVYIQWLSTFNTTYTSQKHIKNNHK